MHANRKRLSPVVVATLAGFFAACGQTSSAGKNVPSRMDLQSGNSQTGSVGTELANPVVVKVTDEGGAAVEGQLVNFRVVSGGGSAFAGSALTNVDGSAQERWTLGPTSGPQQLEARAVDPRTGAAIVFATFYSTAVAGGAVSITAVAGSGQTGLPGAALPNPLRAKVADRYGNRVAGAPVEFVVTGGGGSAVASAATSNEQGEASAAWTLGPRTGAQALETRVTGISPAVFSAEAVPHPGPAQLVVVSGSGQSGVVGATLAQPVVIQLNSGTGVPLAGQPITFRPIAGGGEASEGVVLTGPNGRAQDAWKLGTTVSAQRLEARAIDPATGLTITPVNVDATALPGAAASVAAAAGSGQTGTQLLALPLPVVAHVEDIYGNSIPGAAVAFSAGTGSATPASAATDASGNASSTWTLGPVLGSQTLQASVPGIVPATFSATATAGVVQETMTLVSGDGQTGTAGAILGQPTVVQVNTLAGAPVVGRSVGFEVVSGGGAIVGGALVTGSDGRASASWKLGNVPSAQQLRATATDPISGLTLRPVLANATAVAGPPASMMMIAMSRVALPYSHDQYVIVEVEDALGNPVGGVSVSFVGGTGSGSAHPATVTTDSREGFGKGRATTTWFIGALVGVQTLEARAGEVTFTFSLTVPFGWLCDGAYAAVLDMGPGNSCSGGYAFTVQDGIVMCQDGSNASTPIGHNGSASFDCGSDLRRMFTGTFVVDGGGRASASGAVTGAASCSGSGTWTATRQ